MINIKLLSLFSGIGAFEKALERLQIPYELINYCEIDKYASKAYSLIHNVNESLNLGDITAVDTTKFKNINIDLITYGFPCTDLSVAGKKQGFKDNDGNTTHSGLFFDALRIIEDTKPKFAICENVKNLTGKRFQKEFAIVLDSLNKAGYNNYYKVLNAKDYGIPQNRERVFIISIRKDIDTGYQFPLPYSTIPKIKDILEETVDEKFYLSDERLKNMIEHKRRHEEKGNGWGAVIMNKNDIAPTLMTSPDKYPGEYVKIPKQSDIIQVAQMYPNTGNPQAGRIYDSNGISPSLDTCSSGNRMPKIIDDFYSSREPRVYEDYSLTLRTERFGLKVATDRVRKLTPKECFRLMDFDDRDCDILHENGISNTQIYKMAGNSIVVNVLVEIFKQLQKQYPSVFKE